MRVFESVLCIERDGQRTFTCADKQSVIFPRIMFGDKSDQSFAISLFLILWIGCDIFEFDRFATSCRIRVDGILSLFFSTNLGIINIIFQV